jgi:hypothetical protein
MTQEGTDEAEATGRRGASEEALSMAIYPNPANGEQLSLNVTGLQGDALNVRILDGTGRQVFTARFAGEHSINQVITFDQPLSAGIYVIEVSNNGDILTERMLVQR